MYDVEPMQVQDLLQVKSIRGMFMLGLHHFKNKLFGSEPNDEKTFM